MTKDTIAIALQTANRGNGKADDQKVNIAGEFKHALQHHLRGSPSQAHLYKK